MLVALGICSLQDVSTDGLGPDLIDLVLTTDAANECQIHRWVVQRQ